MIQIDTPNLKRVYQVLTKRQDSSWRGLPGDEWKSSKGLEGEVGQDNTMIRLGPVELSTPLDRLTQLYIRARQEYKTIAILKSRVPGIFDNLSSAYQKEIASNTHYFSQTSDNLTGFILERTDLANRVNRPIITITTDDDKEKTRLIGIGAHGAHIQKSMSEETFTINNGLLHQYLNAVISTIYKSVVPEKTGITIPSLTLTLN